MVAAALRREAFFLPGPMGGRFCLLTLPVCEIRGALLFVPPFAEELNKSRRMVALAARAFAEHGWAVLQIDLLGCGDSAGDFGEATWLAWVDDVALAHQWLKGRCGVEAALWSLRAGSLLASDWFAMEGVDVPWLVWQPVTNGKQHLNQFLRLKGASQMLADADAKAAMGALRTAISRGETVEVAGYALAAGLVKGLEQAVMRLDGTRNAPIRVLEVASGEGGTLSPTVSRLVDEWRHLGFDVNAGAVAGSAFWQTQEIELASELIQRSLTELECFL